MALGVQRTNFALIQFISNLPGRAIISFLAPFLLILVCEVLVVGREHDTARGDGAASHLALGINWFTLAPSNTYQHPGGTFQILDGVVVGLLDPPTDENAREYMTQFNRVGVLIHLCAIIVIGTVTAICLHRMKMTCGEIFCISALVSTMPAMLNHLPVAGDYYLLGLLVTLTGASLSALAADSSSSARLRTCAMFILGFCVANYYTAAILVLAFFTAMLLGFPGRLFHMEKPGMQDSQLQMLLTSLVLALTAMLFAVVNASSLTSTVFLASPFLIVAAGTLVFRLARAPDRVVVTLHSWKPLAWSVLCTISLFFVILNSLRVFAVFSPNRAFIAGGLLTSVVLLLVRKFRQVESVLRWWISPMLVGWFFGADVLGFRGEWATLGLSAVHSKGGAAPNLSWNEMWLELDLSQFLAHHYWHLAFVVLLAAALVTVLPTFRRNTQPLTRFAATFLLLTIGIAFIASANITLVKRSHVSQEFGQVSRYYLVLLGAVPAIALILRDWSPNLRSAVLVGLCTISACSYFECWQSLRPEVASVRLLNQSLDELIDRHLASESNAQVIIARTNYPRRAQVLYALTNYRSEKSLARLNKRSLANGRITYCDSMQAEIEAAIAQYKQKPVLLLTNSAISESQGECIFRSSDVCVSRIRAESHLDTLSEQRPVMLD